MVNDELPQRIAYGTVVVKTSIKQFSKTDVIFYDGSRVENVDYCIFSTGYDFSLPYLENGTLVPAEENKVGCFDKIKQQRDCTFYEIAFQVWLYLQMYQPDLPHQSMAVIGLLQGMGSVWPISELQARHFCHQFAGLAKFPSKDEMHRDIQAKREAVSTTYTKSRRHGYQVNLRLYTDELAEAIGCKPDWKHYFLYDWSFAKRLYFGPILSYRYRLNGPHKWYGAKDAIISVQSRVKKPFQNRVDVDEAKLELKDDSKMFTFMYIVLGVLSYYLFVYFYAFYNVYFS